MPRTTEHGEKTQRVEFTASHTNYVFLNTDEEARSNKSRLLNRLLDYFRSSKNNNSEELELLREKNELETKAKSVDSRLKEIAAQLTHIKYAKERNEANQLKELIKQDKKSACKTCGTKIDNIHSAHGKYQYCKSCYWNSPELKQEVLNKTRKNSITTDNENQEVKI